MNLRFRNHGKWATTTLGVLTLMVVTGSFLAPDVSNYEAYINRNRKPKPQRWVVINAMQLDNGRTLPADTHVILQFPEDMEDHTRRTVFARSEADYWGVCFERDPAKLARYRERGLPGPLFFSESEQEKRRLREEEQLRRSIKLGSTLDERALNNERQIYNRFRHQLEIFEAGDECYVQSSAPIFVGLDVDGDGANSAVERDKGSNALVRDSDSDGVTDGLEIFGLGTDPTKRDSDGDGLGDGIEDKDRDGRRDPDETNALNIDTDGDGLCDGRCLVNKGTELRGEDKNLNGVYEPELNETNPLAIDSDGDGVLDEQEYFNCLLANADNC